MYFVGSGRLQVRHYGCSGPSASGGAFGGADEAAGGGAGGEGEEEGAQETEGETEEEEAEEEEEVVAEVKPQHFNGSGPEAAAAAAAVAGGGGHGISEGGCSACSEAPLVAGRDGGSGGSLRRVSLLGGDAGILRKLQQVSGQWRNAPVSYFVIHSSVVGCAARGLV